MPASPEAIIFQRSDRSRFALNCLRMSLPVAQSPPPPLPPVVASPPPSPPTSMNMNMSNMTMTYSPPSPGMSTTPTNAGAATSAQARPRAAHCNSLRLSGNRTVAWPVIGPPPIDRRWGCDGGIPPQHRNGSASAEAPQGRARVAGVGRGARAQHLRVQTGAAGGEGASGRPRASCGVSSAAGTSADSWRVARAAASVQ